MKTLAKILLGCALIVAGVFLLRAIGISPKPQQPRGRDGQVVTRPRPMDNPADQSTIILGNPTGGGR